VNRSLRQPLGVWRHVYLTLAVLAVALKVMIPPGFMPGAPSNDLPFAIVLCTGEGAITVQAGGTLSGHGDQDHAPAKGPHGSPCAFAGHGFSTPPPAMHDVGQAQFVAHQPLIPSPAPRFTPGAGLSGPPLPARGPPSLLI
jgi:hypothetical protein